MKGQNNDTLIMWTNWTQMKDLNTNNCNIYLYKNVKMMTVTELINSTVNIGYCCFYKENVC